MAKFKIDAPDMVPKHWIGCEVTILQLPGWSVIFPDNYEISRPTAEMKDWPTYCAPARHLAPLTDPGVDAFMERIKRLANEPNNEVSKEGKPHLVRFVKETGE